MPGPWEKYAAAQAPEEGPWTKFAAPKAVESSGRPGLSQMQFTPDVNVAGPVGTFLGSAAQSAGVTGLAGMSPDSGHMRPPPGLEGVSQGQIQQAVEKPIEQSAAENPTAAALGTGFGIVAQAAATDIPFTGAMKVGAEALGDVSKLVASKVIPLTQKSMRFLRTPEAVAAFNRTMRDIGVTTVPRTLRKLGEHLTDVKKAIDPVLTKAYQAIDKAASKFYNGQQIADKVIDSLRTVTKNKPLLEAQYEAAADAIRKEFTATDAFSFTDVINKARAFEGDYDPAVRSLFKKVGLATRVANEELARTVAPEQAVKLMRQVSDSWSKITVAHDAVQAQLKKKPSLWRETAKMIRHFTAQKVFGPAGAAASIGYDAAQTTVAKTTAAAAAKFGSELLGKALALGPWGKMLMRTAATGGMAAMLERHASLMIDNPKYAALVDKVFSAEPGAVGSLPVGLGTGFDESNPQNTTNGPAYAEPNAE